MRTPRTLRDLRTVTAHRQGQAHIPRRLPGEAGAGAPSPKESSNRPLGSSLGAGKWDTNTETRRRQFKVEGLTDLLQSDHTLSKKIFFA